jgi:hypothetical protein
MKALRTGRVSSGWLIRCSRAGSSLIDWGIKDGHREKNPQCLHAVTELIDRYRPDVLAVEDASGSRR